MFHIQSLEAFQFLEADQLVELVAGAYLDGLHGEVFTFVDGLDRFQINARLLQRDVLGAVVGPVMSSLSPTLTSAASTRNSATPMLEK